jgi:hypothetical protein
LPHQQAGHVTAPDQCCRKRQKVLAMAPSTRDPNGTMEAWKEGVLHAAGQRWNIQRLQRSFSRTVLLIWINVGTLVLGALADGSSSQGDLT